MAVETQCDVLKTRCRHTKPTFTICYIVCKVRVCGCAERLSDKVTRNLPPLPLHSINRHGVSVLLYDSAMKGQDEGIRISDNRSDACWVQCSVFTLRSLRLFVSLSSSHRVRACTQRDMQLDRVKDMNTRTTTLTQRRAHTHTHTQRHIHTQKNARTHTHTHRDACMRMNAHLPARVRRRVYMHV